MAQIYISEASMKLAVEIAKSGMAMNSGTLMTTPETVAKFLEVVSTKIETLRLGPQA